MSDDVRAPWVTRGGIFKGGTVASDAVTTFGIARGFPYSDGNFATFNLTTNTDGFVTSPSSFSLSDRIVRANMLAYVSSLWAKFVLGQFPSEISGKYVEKQKEVFFEEPYSMIQFQLITGQRAAKWRSGVASFAPLGNYGRYAFGTRLAGSIAYYLPWRVLRAPFGIVTPPNFGRFDSLKVDFPEGLNGFAVGFKEMGTEQFTSEIGGFHVWPPTNQIAQ